MVVVDKNSPSRFSHSFVDWAAQRLSKRDRKQKNNFSFHQIDKKKKLIMTQRSVSGRSTNKSRPSDWQLFTNNGNFNNPLPPCRRLNRKSTYYNRRLAASELIRYSSKSVQSRSKSKLTETWQWNVLYFFSTQINQRLQPVQHEFLAPDRSLIDENLELNRLISIWTKNATLSEVIFLKNLNPSMNE